MSVFEISDLTQKITREIDDLGLGIGESDPETWEHLFEDDILDGLRNIPASLSPPETDAFRALYRAIKTVIDEALLPSTLVEASHVFKYQVAGALEAIARKDATVGKEIYADLQNSYRNHEDIDIRSTAKATMRKIEAILGDSVTAEFAAAAGLNPALAGKTVVFTGTLSVPRKQAAETAEARGLHVSNTVSKNTQFLVAGADVGERKFDKARELGVQILTEAEWNVLLTAAPAAAVDKDVTLLRPFQFRKS
jgi:NAD-dependent DNA ligase